MNHSRTVPGIYGYAYWLMPGQDESNFFKEEINRLAGRFNSPVFLPHVTLSGVPDSLSEPILKNNLKEIASVAHSFRFSAGQFHCGKIPYQKITLELNRPKPYLELCTLCDRVYSGSFSKTKYPHISVFYGSQSCEMLAEVLDKLNQKQLPSEITIESIALAKFQGTPESWQIVESINLPKR